MDGFKRPMKPRARDVRTGQAAQGAQQLSQRQPESLQASAEADTNARWATAKSPEAEAANAEALSPDATSRLGNRRRSKKKITLWALGVALIIFVTTVLWYVLSLAPVDPQDDSRQRIVIEPGSSFSEVIEALEEKRLVRSRLASVIYARSINASARLKAGSYSLSPSESTPEIMEHIVAGSVDQFSLTFLPGATLRRLPGETGEQRTDIKSALLNAGYSDSEIETAFSKDYDHPLFASKPASADLEGYVFGETYNFASSSTVEQILVATFDHYYGIIEENDLIQKFKKQGLTLYEGITLASIIQREVRSAEDQRQVAQIFLDRLSIEMSLGADATFEYAAKKDNTTPSPDLDSPYNTRKYKGLPPGPIASPGLSALLSVANPAEGDYLYFVSGDDGVNHFSRTSEEHEANARKYCPKTCFGL